jgi:hypothetical protein
MLPLGLGSVTLVYVLAVFEVSPDLPVPEAVEGPVEAFVIVVSLPPPTVKPIAIPATAAAPSNARTGPFHLTGGHLIGLAGDAARIAGPATGCVYACNPWRNGSKTS